MVNTEEILYTGYVYMIYNNVDPPAVIRCCKGKNNYSGKYNKEQLKWRSII